VAEIPCPLSEAARIYGDLPAVISWQETISYGDYESRVAAAAERLAECGIQKSERIALLLENSAEYAIFLFALFRIGAIACLFSTRLPEASVIESCNRIACRALITDRKFADLDSIRRLHPGELTARDTHEMRRDRVIDLGQPAAIILTSGTSSAPKPALLTYGNLYYNAKGSNANIAFGPGDRWLQSLPLYHVGGLGILFRAVLGGGAVVIPQKGQTIGESAERHAVTHLSLVSTQLRELVDQVSNSAHKPSTLKAVLLGGGPFGEPLLEKAVAAGFPIYSSYGLTEMASQVTASRPREPLSKPLSAGKVLPYREVAISAEQEILVRGETLFAGYVNSERVVSAVDGDGWFHTRDIGSLDVDENLTVTGRLDNMFVSGGENIQPEEIEDVLLQIDGVERALVVPSPDAKYGMRPVAFVQSGSDAIVDVEKLRTQLRAVLPGYKCPDRFFPWPANIRTAGIKPSRAEFARLASEKLGSET
jgi:O-succinylbenzoic acid--CoA ligase